MGEEWFIECQFKKEDSWNFLDIVSPVGYLGTYWDSVGGTSVADLQ